MKLAANWSIATLLIALGSGCADLHGQPFNPNLIGHEYYLCCTLRFAPELRASDANYGTYRSDIGYAPAYSMLTAGTPVTVLREGSSAVAFRTETGAVYTINFSYGRKQQTPDQYFQRIFLTTDPMSRLGTVSSKIAAGIQKGKLVEGMTKAQALMARGYPPAHHTPSIDADEWIFYDTPGLVDRVVFADGTIHSITRGPAPR